MEMIDFREMPYTRPDLDSLRAVMTSAAETMRNAKSYEEARTVWFDLQKAEEQVDTLFSLAYVRSTIDTRDEFYSAEVKYLNAETARMIPLEKAWSEAFAASPFRPDFEKEFGKQLFRRIDASLRTMDERIVQDRIREGELRQEYQKTTAQASTTFRGEQVNFYGLLKHMESTDRDERREAYHAWAALYAEISPTLDAQYDELVQLRDRMAKTLGFPSYTEMAYLQRGHYDYTQEDTAAFRKQIREIVTPAVAELRERQRVRLGLDRLCYYDEALFFPEGNADPEGTEEELVARAQRMYREMSPETGEFFDFMVQYHLFDLETRPGKQMGGYMTRFPGYKAPFIFSNFNGTSADVDVLTHEAGHAFQGSGHALHSGELAVRLHVGDQRNALHEHGALRLSLDEAVLRRPERRLSDRAPFRRARRAALHVRGGRIPAPRVRKSADDRGGAPRRLAGDRKKLYALAGL